MKRTWHNGNFDSPDEISAPEDLEDFGYDVYTKAGGIVCAVAGTCIIAEYTDELYGSDAYEALSVGDQAVLWQIMVDEAGDMSTRDTAHMMMADMSLAEMRERLNEELSD